jgi:hypothetical protein
MDATAQRLDTGRIRVEVDGEAVECSPAWYRAVMHSMRLQDLIRRESRPQHEREVQVANGNVRDGSDG